MPTDDERFRFLDPKGATLTEATDAAIERWEKKHGKRWIPEHSSGIVKLPLRGWVS